jgi:hypothetical protein
MGSIMMDIIGNAEPGSSIGQLGVEVKLKFSRSLESPT